MLNFKKLHFCSYFVRKANIWRAGRAGGTGGRDGRDGGRDGSRFANGRRSRALATILDFYGNLIEEYTISNKFCIEIMFWGSDLVRIDSGIFRNMFKSYFVSVGHAAGVFCLFQKIHIPINLDMVILFESYVLPVGHAAGILFLPKHTHSQNFGHGDFSKSELLSTTRQCCS